MIPVLVFEKKFRDGFFCSGSFFIYLKIPPVCGFRVGFLLTFQFGPKSKTSLEIMQTK